ncbi:MAG: hypothetical protein EA417_01860 [Gammaproteobacteria bacterium]|nr:MAG: hypothetical protein EA417_01860 [Gammaproteobacteria bacterium]
MALTLNPRFSLVGWSLAVFLVYVLIQVVTTFLYAMLGAAFHPALGMFVWFCASASMGYALLIRHEASRADLALVQAFSCFYIALTAVAITLQSATPFSALVLAQILAVVLGFFLNGVIAFELSRFLVARSSHATARRFS